MNLSRLRPLVNSFNARIIGTAVLLLTVTTMALNYYFYIRTTIGLRAELTHHNQSLARIMAHSSRLGIFTANKDILLANALLLADEKDCWRIFFLDDSGYLLFDYPGWATPPVLAGTVNGQTIYQQILSHREEPSFSYAVGADLIMVEPVPADQKSTNDDLFSNVNEQSQFLAPGPKPLGYVALAISTSAHRDQARAIFMRDTLITSVVTLISCLIIFVVIHLFTRPLRQLTREILRPGANADPHAAQEAIPLNFSHMIETIRHAYRTITDLKNTLEDKVASRTRQLVVSNEELTIKKNGLTAANQKLAVTLSQLQATQAQLVQSEKMAALGMLIAGLSHEIKNSINFISCSVPLLKRNLASINNGKPPGEGGEGLWRENLSLLDNIQEGVDRTVRVIDDLAHFSHSSEAGFAPTDIQLGIKTSVAILRREYGRRIEINEEYDPALPLIEGRSGQLNQVFINILLNAAHAIADEGTIKVKTWAEATTVHVSVTDSGHGIKGQIINRIYDPFFTTKEIGQGTGLGLSISYTVIKNHDGELKVNSRPGVGTTFEIVLPIKQSWSQKTAPATSPKAEG